jgi:hypothetical protein
MADTTRKGSGSREPDSRSPQVKQLYPAQAVFANRAYRRYISCE